MRIEEGVLFPRVVGEGAAPMGNFYFPREVSNKVVWGRRLEDKRQNVKSIVGGMRTSSQRLLRRTWGFLGDMFFSRLLVGLTHITNT